MPYDEVARDLIMKFQRNFTKLREFLERVDRDIAQLNIFKASAGIQGDNGFDEEIDYDEEDENDCNLANNTKRGAGGALSPKNNKFGKQNTGV